MAAVLRVSSSAVKLPQDGSDAQHQMDRLLNRDERSNDVESIHARPLLSPRTAHHQSHSSESLKIVPFESHELNICSLTLPFHRLTHAYHENTVWSLLSQAGPGLREGVPQALSLGGEIVSMAETSPAVIDRKKKPLLADCSSA